ncbi:MAG TPA: hypothetical protein VFB85_04365 [Vicinamibacterales bacterium]|jgi:hypothetical protein|nr:hypothetical protein [Vicinamibacterales bacterium]
MSAEWKPAAESLATDLRAVFRDRFLSLVAYGPQLEGDATAPLTCLALVTSLTVDDLHACAKHAPRWARAHVATPLILPEHEFRRSLDAFPLEYGEIIRAHARVVGNNPFDGIAIAREDLRRACETQIKSHLVHLREGYIESGGSPGAVAELVAASAPAFTALLRNVARLNGVTTSDRTDATRQGARGAGLPEHVVDDVAALEQKPGHAGVDAARLFPDYLAAIEQLARAVDAWHPLDSPRAESRGSLGANLSDSLRSLGAAD